MTCRKRMNDVKTGVESLPRDQRWGDPLTASVASGMKVARVRPWLEHGTWGTCRLDAKGGAQVEAPRGPEYQCGAQGRMGS